MPFFVITVVMLAGVVLVLGSLNRVFEFSLDVPALSVRNGVETAQFRVRVKAIERKNALIEERGRALLGESVPRAAGAVDLTLDDRLSVFDADADEESARIEEAGAVELGRKARLRYVALAVDIVLVLVGAVLIIGGGITGITMIA